MRVAFRVDASIDIGTGHVMRCITLARALQEQGEECHFICREHPGNSIKSIEDSGFPVSSLSNFFKSTPSCAETSVGDPVHAAWLGCDWPVDAAQTQEILEELEPSWLVVDHYALDSRWEAAIRENVGYLFAIDDLADRKHSCDLLLDQNLGRKEEDYYGLVPDYCKLLIGPRNALLRPEFSRLRDYSLQRRKQSHIQNVLVFMGGIDKGNATGRVLEAIGAASLPSGCEITVVMGGNAPWLDTVREQSRNLPYHVALLVNIDDMAQRMADSDLAIGAAGSASWERCCLGLPSLVIALADNQEPGCRNLVDAGAAKALEFNEISAMLPRMLQGLLRNKDDLQEMSIRCSRITKGDGVKHLNSYLSDMVQNDAVK